MNETATTAAVTRTAIRKDLDATKAAYHELVGRISDAQWKSRSGNPGWTCGQLAWHLASGLKYSATIVEKARSGKHTNPPGFLLPLAFKANEFLVRRQSRGATPASVLADYDAADAKLRTLLDELRDEEFALSATNFGQTQTVPEMFGVVTEHFAEHSPEIRNAPASG